MHPMQRKIRIVFLLLLLPLFGGCDPFQLPKGTWVCEELNMTLEFVYRDGHSAVGTIVQDDETLEIACVLRVAGTAAIGHLSDTAGDILDSRYLYRGQFRHKGKNKMHLIVTADDTPNEDKKQKEYTFIKLEDPEANAPLFPKKADGSGPSDAIFGRDGKIWFYNAKTDAFSILGSELTKYGPVLSPKGDKILFRADLADTQDVTQQVGLLHTDDSGERLFSIGHAGTNQVLSLTWIDNQRFLAQYHVNPSTNQVFVVDAESGETLAMYAGLHFQLLNDGRVVYMDNVPHGFPDMAHYSVAVDDAIVYTSPVKGKPITALAVFEGGAKLAILESFREQDTAEPVLTVGMLEGNAFSEQTRLALPEGNWQLWVTEDGALRLSDQKAAYSLDEQGNLTEQKAGVFTKTQPGATQHRAFAKKIEKKLGPAKDGIYSITFLP